MENLVKEIVKEELQRIKDKEKPSCSKSAEQLSNNNRAPEMVSRMNSLLNRITTKASGSKKTTGRKQKPMTIQVRYEREIFGVKESVSPKEGGDSRFITFNENDPSPTFQELMNSCFNIYFIDGENFYGEREGNVNIELLEITERTIKGDEKVSEYLHKRGLYHSKTWFIFKTTNVTKEIKEEPVNVKDENGTEIVVSSDDDNNLPNLPLKRKICNVCSKTYFVTCVNCKQAK